MLNELLPAAATWRWEFIYANLWEDKERPMDVIVDAVEKAAGITPALRVDRELSGGIAVGFGSASGKRTVIGVEATVLQRWKRAIEALAKRGRTTLLVIDEFQTLHHRDPEARATAALRTAFEANSGWLRVLMTGSDRAALTEIFRRHQSPLLGQAARVDLPALGPEFDAHRVAGVEAATSRRPVPSALDVGAARIRLGNSPELLNKALSRWVSGEAATLDDAAALVEAELGDAGYEALFEALGDVAQQVLVVCAFERAIYTNIPTMAANLGRPLKATTVQSAERTLVKRELIGLTGENGLREVLDPGLAIWLQRRYRALEWKPAKPRGAPRRRK
ncbi:hypothetical protein [Silanimonas sp.]|uniref:hypothetical protein n=1 Tax=Silanimonas sp. TaxID=1929290 RepID=UPI001BB81CF2|nr:hypothetical protein [Silanimonas sp.]MBS3896801.1 hypothetical protein [Silanimonas sp.]